MGADVKIIFSADTTAVEKACELMKADIVQAFSSLGLAANGVKVAFDTVASAFAPLQGAIAASSAAESLSLSLETMLGSTQAAQTALGRLNSYAAETPYAINDISAAYKKLIAFMGRDNSDAAFQTLQQLGNIAAAAESPATALSDLADAFGKSFAGEILTLEDINKFSDRGLNVLGLLADKLGTTQSALRKMVSSGKVSVGELQWALEKATSAGGQFEGMTKKLSTSFAGRVSTLSDNFTALQRTMGESLTAALNPLLASITEALPNFAPTFAAIGQQLAAAVAPIANELPGIMDSVGSMASTLASVLSATLVPAVTVAADVLSFLADGSNLALVAFILFARSINRNANVATMSVTQMCNRCRASMVAFGTAVRQQGGVVTASLNMIKGRALAGLKAAWATTWAGMVGIVKSAAIAIKSALISTGIGAIVWALGEGVGALYDFFASSANAAKEADKSFTQVTRTVDDLMTRAKTAKSGDEAAALMDELSGMIDDLQQRAEAEDNPDLALALQQQVLLLQSKAMALAETAKASVIAADAEEKRAAAAREAAAADAATVKAREKANEEVAKYNDAQAKKAAEKSYADMAPQDAVNARLRAVNVSSVAELERLVKATANRAQKATSAQAVEEEMAAWNRYKDALEGVRKEEERAAKASQELADKTREAQENFASDRWNEQYANVDIQAKERMLRNRMAEMGMEGKDIRSELAKMVYTDPVGNAKEIEQLGSMLDLWNELERSKREYAETAIGNQIETQARLMELQGDTVGAQQLRDEETTRKRIMELQKSGYSQIAATMQAQAEQALTVAERASKANKGVFIAQQGANLGNGGTVISLGFNAQLSQAKKSNNLLSAIKKTLEDIKQLTPQQGITVVP